MRRSEVRSRRLANLRRRKPTVDGYCKSLARTVNLKQGEAHVVGRVKKLILALSALGLLAMASPAQASQPIADSDIGSVRVVANGSVRVAVDYRCPSEFLRPLAYITVSQGETAPVYKRVTDLVCDGSHQSLHRRVKGPFEPHHKRLWVEFSLWPSHRLDRVSSAAEAAELYSVRTDGSTKHSVFLRLAPIERREHRIVVKFDYRCPTGWRLWGAEIKIDQYFAHNASTRSSIADDIVCDNTNRRDAARLPTRGLRFTDAPVRVWAEAHVRGFHRLVALEHLPGRIFKKPA
jgi:hypothetical protein